MLNEDALLTYWESRKPKVDIRMRDALGNVTVFWEMNQECVGDIKSADFFKIGDRDWISRAQMEELVVAVK